MEIVVDTDDVVLRKEDSESLSGEMESLIETIEILSDENLMEQIRESEKDIREGNIFEINSEEDLFEEEGKEYGDNKRKSGYQKG